MNKPDYSDPAHEGNSSKYHTGKPCAVSGCKNPAGTMWGTYWCFEHNVERIERTDKNLRELQKPKK